MVNKTPLENIASEEEAPQHVFGNGVSWNTLAPSEEPIKDPTVGTQFHLPTSDDVSVVEKKKYSQTFDRAPFVGVAKVDKIDRFKKRKIGRATGKFNQEIVKIENGGPTSEFLRENNLDHTSLPHECFEVFLPRRMNSSWTSYTNTKALMQNAGVEEEIRVDFSLYPRILHQCLGFRVWPISESRVVYEVPITSRRRYKW